MSAKDFSQMVKRLRAQGLITDVVRGAKHPILILAGGARYTIPWTPSDWRGIKNAESHIKRLARR